MTDEKALSEIVGAIILVALVITGIGIIGVLMLSTPPPAAKEKAVLSSSCIDCDGTKFMVLISHEGGDTIHSGRLKFNLETKFQNGTAFELIEDIDPSYYFPAEDYSAFSRYDICHISDPVKYDFAKMESMKSGDVIGIVYVMV